MQALNVENKSQADSATGLIELRFTNPKGKTEVWIIQPPAEIDGFGPTFNPQEMAGCGEVVRAYIDDGVDARLAVQAASVDRLAKHVSHHHDQLAIVAFEECDFMNPKEGK